MPPSIVLLRSKYAHPDFPQQHRNFSSLEGRESLVVMIEVLTSLGMRPVRVSGGRIVWSLFLSQKALKRAEVVLKEDMARAC
jgi:hypothetical protein